jgi:hypothetical protein
MGIIKIPLKMAKIPVKGFVGAKKVKGIKDGAPFYNPYQKIKMGLPSKEEIQQKGLIAALVAGGAVSIIGLIAAMGAMGVVVFLVWYFKLRK